MYQHRNWQGELLDLPTGKVVCVGSNYALHIQEMASVTPDEPVLFIKPETALCDLTQPVVIPRQWGDVHHEIELAVLINATLKQADAREAAAAIGGYGIALDLTLRTLQKQLKARGQPWEKAKSFDGACPVSGFIPPGAITDPQNCQLLLAVNGQLRQQGSTAEMLTPLFALLAYMSRFFTLRPGDIVLTGTPQGVGPLQDGDALEARLNDYVLHTHVMAA